MAVPRSQGFHDRAQSCAAHPDRAAHRLDPLLGACGERRDLQRLADREERDRERRHLDAVEQVGDAEGQPRLPGLQVDADEPERQPEEQRGQPAQRRVAEGGRDGDEGEHHQREVVGRPERQRELHHPRRDEGEAEGGDQPGDERADRRRGQRRPAAALARHLVALERGDDRGALARRVEQDRGGRAAVHAAVVDAGEHDQRGGRVELVGDRQQQRDGQRRADAGQHADRGAERDADQRVEQVHRLQRAGEAVGEEREGVHGASPGQKKSRSSGPAGSERLRRPAKISQIDERQDDAERDGEPERPAAEAPRGEGEQEPGGDREAERLQQQHLQHQPADDPEHRPRLVGLARRQRRGGTPSARADREHGEEAGRSRRASSSARRGRTAPSTGIARVCQKITAASTASAAAMTSAAPSGRRSCEAGALIAPGRCRSGSPRSPRCRRRAASRSRRRRG